MITLGTHAMYLGSTLYRIHGSTDPDSVGEAESSGCFRMRNVDVADLYKRVPVGTTAGSKKRSWPHCSASLRRLSNFQRSATDVIE